MFRIDFKEQMLYWFLDIEGDSTSCISQKKKKVVVFSNCKNVSENVCKVGEANRD